MKREANLFILFYKSWKPLVELIENNKYNNLVNDVIIYQLMNSSSKNEHYAIVSLSEIADKIILEYGATPASERDALRTTLHNYLGAPLYGDKENIIYLNKLK